MTYYWPKSVSHKVKIFMTLITGFISRLHCPLVDGKRQSFKAPDGATVTYDIYQPIEEHSGGGEIVFSKIVPVKDLVNFGKFFVSVW
jgi:hypothetical protein